MLVNTAEAASSVEDIVWDDGGADGPLAGSTGVRSCEKRGGAVAAMPLGRRLSCLPLKGVTDGMGGDGAGGDGVMDADHLAAIYAQRRAERAELTGDQLAVLDALWRAQRAGEVTATDAAEIEAVIRDGRVHGARKRLTNARRSSKAAPH
ncbi:MAG: hypothetical protein GEV07_20560 [Streptosporangiales bacterium]|nr:hypothetical protein [Streptosporangiales bacterium]